MTKDQIITEINSKIVNAKLPKLDDKEVNTLLAAYDNLSRPIESGERGIVKGDFTQSPYFILEKSGVGKFALDANSFQVIRARDPKTAKHGDSWLRYGFNIIKKENRESIKPFFHKSMYEFNDLPVNLSIDLPASAAHLNSLYKRGQRVVAFLGTARVGISDGMLLIEHVQKIVDALSDVAIVTGGYRGEEGNSYGITRAGFDVPKSRGMETMVVMCEAGLGHAHQTADSRSIYGKNWGDDTPGLTAVSDFAVFFRNVPPGKNYGAWTEVEMANFIYHKKGVAIFDPTVSKDKYPDGVQTETYFGTEVNVFRNPDDLAKYVSEELPAQDDVKGRKPFVAETDLTKISPFNQPFQSDLFHEDFLAVRLFYKRQNENRVVDDERMAMWVKNDRSLFTKVSDVFKFHNGPGAFEEGRDLILSGYYKDILLLQILGKLNTNDSMDNLIKGYAIYRSEIEKNFANPNSDFEDASSHWYDHGKIGDIWFLYRAEHIPGFLKWLKNIELNNYIKKLNNL